MTKKLFIGLVVIGIIALAASVGLSVDYFEDDQFIYPEYSKPISMDFKKARLDDVLKIFSQQSGLNFIAAQDISDKNISLYLDAVPVEEALEKILKANDLTYETDPLSGIFIVRAIEKPTVERITRIYELQHASVSTTPLLTTLNIQSDDSEQTGAQAISLEENVGILGAIRTILTQHGNLVEDPRTNSLIITDIPSQFPIIEQTIARLDRPIPQILIEVEMLDVSEKTADLMGIKYGDTPFSFAGGERFVLYPFEQNNILEKGRFAFNPSSGSSDPEFVAGKFSAAGLTAILQFLRTQTDTKNLARPRILTLNNQMAQIKISTDEAIGLETTTEASEGVSTQSLEAERVETGVFLTVTPQANLATKEITMAIVPKVIQARSGATFEGRTFKDPEERGSQSILKVRDGDTIMLGGLVRTDSTHVITKIPLLGDLPVVGGAFRHKDTNDTQRELIIFITPHIVEDTVAANTITSKKSREIIREQNIPLKRQKEVDKALSKFQQRL